MPSHRNAVSKVMSLISNFFFHSMQQSPLMPCEMCSHNAGKTNRYYIHNIWYHMQEQVVCRSYALVKPTQALCNHTEMYMYAICTNCVAIFVKYWHTQDTLDTLVNLQHRRK